MLEVEPTTRSGASASMGELVAIKLDELATALRVEATTNDEEEDTSPIDDESAMLEERDALVIS